MSKSALGRGLGALLSGAPKATPSLPPVTPSPSVQPVVEAGIQRVSIHRIRPSPLQPRKDFPEETLRELSESIREQGIVQPLIVRKVADHFELIAGERRWRAAQLVGLGEVPILERLATDREVLELALIENLQRENLNPLEEAQGYSQLLLQFELTQEQVAQKVGRGRVAVANSLRLLKLPETVQAMVREGRLTVGHAKVILGIQDSNLQKSVAERVLAGNLTVRQTEALISQMLASGIPRPNLSIPSAPSHRDPHVVDLEGRLRERFSAKVALRYSKGRGAVEVRFNSDDELQRILDLIGVNVD